MHLLVLNCGSATVKYRLFEAGAGDPVELSAGTLDVDGDHRSAIEKIVSTLPEKPGAVAHRVVHGGDAFRAPVTISPDVLDTIRALSDLAPLHNPPAVAGIEAAESLGVPQVAAFDTAFHRTIPEHARRYALPTELAEKHGLKRYGFHGHSFHYVTGEYAKLTGSQSPTIVILHLGNGASAAAVKDGACIDTSMGITPLEGLVMGSRAGDIDPGIPIRLQRKGMSLDEVEELLWRGAGLKGMAGDNDMRTLLARDDEEARLAVNAFCYRARKYVGAYLAALGGAEAIVFTGGIGENAPAIRARILADLEAFGMELDPGGNERGETRISKETARLHAYVIATNEELLIAREALRVLTAD